MCVSEPQGRTPLDQWYSYSIHSSFIPSGITLQICCMSERPESRGGVTLGGALLKTFAVAAVANPVPRLRSRRPSLQVRVFSPTAVRIQSCTKDNFAYKRDLFIKKLSFVENHCFLHHKIPIHLFLVFFISINLFFVFLIYLFLFRHR